MMMIIPIYVAFGCCWQGILLLWL